MTTPVAAVPIDKTPAEGSTTVERPDPRQPQASEEDHARVRTPTFVVNQISAGSASCSVAT
jgi:hypothetical protein